MKTLIDNNIQVHRLVARRWKTADCDRVFERLEPVTTDYVLMEFRKTVIKSLRLLRNLISDVLDARPEANDHDTLRERLGELLAVMSTEPTRYLTSRNRTLLLGIIAYLLKENTLFIEGMAPTEFMEFLDFWSEELETRLFFVFVCSGRVINVRENGNHLEVFDCPLSYPGDRHTCQRGKLECRAVNIIQTGAYRRIMEKIISAEADGYRSLTTVFQGKAWQEMKNGRSLGQGICFTIADTYHVATCLIEGLGLLTSDGALAMLARSVEVPVNHFSVKDFSFTS